MKIMRICLSLFFLLAISSELGAYPKEHGPFAAGEFPIAVKFIDCVVVKREEITTRNEAWPRVLFFAQSKKEGELIVKVEPSVQTNGWNITVLDGKGLAISGSATNDTSGDVLNVWSADLNKDSKPDFVVYFGSTGCGLAAEGTTHTFLLSSGTQYVATNFYSFYFGMEDVVKFKKGGPCYFIYNDVIGNSDEKTRDGRDHNFWVYQLYRFEGSKMVLANEDDSRFPKWVWYTFKENHRETDQLTKEQKQRLLENM